MANTVPNVVKPLPDELAALLKDVVASKELLLKQLEKQKQELQQVHSTTVASPVAIEKAPPPIQPQEKNIVTPQNGNAANSVQIADVSKISLESAERVAALREKIKAQLALVGRSAVERFVPPPLRLDEKGREIDEKGNVLQKVSIESLKTLKANQNLKSKLTEMSPATIMSTGKTSTSSGVMRASYFDPNLSLPKSERKRRSVFNFLEAGSIVKKAEKLRAKVIKEESASSAETPFSLLVEEMKKEMPSLKRKPKEPIPDVEWWDRFLVPGDAESYIVLDELEFSSGSSSTGSASKPGSRDRAVLKLDDVTIYVEHPVPVRPTNDLENPPAMPMFLTQKEQKKMRKRTRMERERERQEEVLLGLRDPPKPKVKLSNLMRVLGAEATADPTKIEQEVKRQTEERIASHEARNQARKLTKEQRKEKKRTKLAKDAALGLQVALFRLTSLADPKHRFKVDSNARQLILSGCAIIFGGGMDLVIVEGGAKSIRKFKKLMLSRIDWNKKANEDDVSATTQSNSGQVNKCTLIWEGTALKSNFQQFRFETFTSEAAVRKYLNQHWSEHYWDLAKNFKEED